MPYRCRDCRQHFSVRTGTVLAESRLPLQKWLMAIYMMTTARKGIPSTQMARELGITQSQHGFSPNGSAKRGCLGPATIWALTFKSMRL